MRYVALLRGINVGGNNLIKMIDLKACFEGLGFDAVVTYIQSGNVVFETPARGADKLAARIEAALLESFGYDARIVLRSRTQMRALVADAPAGFGSQPDLYRYDVLFLRPPFTVADAMKELNTREGVDQICAGVGACYFSRLISRASESYLSRLAGLPVYKSMTVRNWNTTTRLIALMDG